MSAPQEPDFDLEKLFLPAWAQEPSSVNKYAKFAGDDRRDSDDRRERHGRRPPPRRDSGPRDRDRSRGPQDRGPQMRGGGPPRPGQDRGRPQGRGRNFQRPDRDEHRPPPEPLPEINTTILPDEAGVDGLTRQIKMTGRAYPLFQIAQLILQKPERYSVQFDVIKKADGQIAQPLFLCALDDTLWLSEDEVVSHILARHFQTFYQPERVQIDPPKGVYTFVGQCGISGTILGPPNYHDYQNQLRKLHTQRFANMPFDMFKARVKIVRDEAVVKKWIEDQSFKTEYVCLNVPEAKRLGSREELEKHFRETHLANILKQVESHKMTGVASRQIRSHGLSRAARFAWEEQGRFPLKLATILSQEFAARGLQFFKVNKTVTHVSVARPHFLDLETTPVSDGVRKIVEFVNAHPKCTRRKLFETIAPSPVPASAPAEPPKEGETVAAAETTPEQNAVIADLHWLIHQGHVIEFATGLLETAKKPLPRPPKPQQPKTEAPVETVPAGESPEITAAEAAASGAPMETAPAAESETDEANGEPPESSPTPAAEASPESVPNAEPTPS